MRYETNSDKAHTTINLTLSALKGVADECLFQKPFFDLPYRAELRRSEITLLNISDIKDNSVLVNGKGNKSRKIYLPPFVLESVLKFKKILKRKSGALFSSINKNEEITSNRISSMGLGLIIN